MSYRERNGVTGITHSQAQPPPAPAQHYPDAKPVTPLAPGRYWVTAFGDKANALDAYFSAMNKVGYTRVEVTQGINSTTDNAAGSFYIFNVLKTVGWFATVFGKPSVAGPNIHSAADTAQVPDAPTPLSTLNDFFGALMTGEIGKAILAGVVVYAITEGFKGRRS